MKPPSQSHFKAETSSDRYVELIDITKVYGSLPIVNSVRLSIRRGEFITLLGPSGCGKTTTLKMIAGFVEPTAGEIRIKGELVNEKPPYMRNTSMVFQNYALFPHLTIFENVAFGLRLRKYAKEEIERKVREALELVQLPGVERRYPRELSGGQQQRVALARALVIEPDVLLLDEPLSSLDLKLRQALRLEIKSIQRMIGITTIYVTHDQGEALVMSDEVVVMDQGKIMQSGPPIEVYERPANEFVARFLGEANILSGRVQSTMNDDALVALHDGLSIITSTNLGAQIAKNAEVRISIRPERIYVSSSTTRKTNSFRGRIEEVIYSGSEVRYQVSVQAHRLVIDKKIEELSALRSVGEDVYVEWDKENCTLLLS
jgi:spermidine/putrescine ABC transporter ATP-binding subunit